MKVGELKIELLKRMGEIISIVDERSKSPGFDINDYGVASLIGEAKGYEKISKLLDDEDGPTGHFKFERGGFIFHGWRKFTGDYTIQMEIYDRVCFWRSFKSENEVTEEMWFARADEIISENKGKIPKLITDFSDKGAALEYLSRGSETVLSSCGKFVLDEADIEEYFAVKEEQK
jgi:hypothetical protein